MKCKIISGDVMKIERDERRFDFHDIGQLLLRHAAGFSCPLDGEPYIVKIKSSFISLNFHNIT